jgi:hypothetical protein
MEQFGALPRKGNGTEDSLTGMEGKGTQKAEGLFPRLGNSREKDYLAHVSRVILTKDYGLDTNIPSFNKGK